MLEGRAVSISGAVNADVVSFTADEEISEAFELEFGNLGGARGDVVLILVFLFLFLSAS
jgi:hypothetical protein